MGISSGSPKKESHRISWPTGWCVSSNLVSSHVLTIRPTSRRRFTASPSRPFSLFLCWRTWARGDVGTLLRPGNSRSARSFLKKAASECGRPSWPNSEASTWERLRRVGQSPPSFRPLLSLLSDAKLRPEQAVRLDSLHREVARRWVPGSILMNAHLVTEASVISWSHDLAMVLLSLRPNNGFGRGRRLIYFRKNQQKHLSATSHSKATPSIKRILD
jgi:hypothetical protein